MSTNRSLTVSYRFCDQLAHREARNFYFAFRLLPSDRRQSMSALYAFMRHTDDLADEPASLAQKSAALERWRAALDAALGGDPSAWPGLPALADTVARHGIPGHLLHEVIHGVTMDLKPRPFARFDELADYCYRVASVVGLCCIHIWGYTSEDGRAERLAEGCGIALQLTNILRDVKEDARNGRIYLPQDDMARFGVDPRELLADRPGQRLRDLLSFEAKRAYGYYAQAHDLVELIEPRGRPVLLTIVGIYKALLDEIARRDYNVFENRVSIPKWRKAVIAMGAIPHRFHRPLTARAPTPVP